MSVVNAQTVLTALDNLQKSYLLSKKDMASTLEKINNDLHTIEKCTETLLKNYSDKKELQEEIEKLVDDGKKTKELKKESDKIKIINEKVKSLEKEIKNKESENISLLNDIKHSTEHMKSMCVQNKKLTGLDYGEKKDLSDSDERKETDVDELDGGYKHSSRKSRSKSTRKRVRNKFKKIKIFSKKRSNKKRNKNK